MADDPREALLAVARDIIAQRGYLGLTLRTAAAAAGTTPDVAMRYYRNRDDLFAAALKLPVDPASAIPALVAPGIEGMGERLVRFMLETLKDPEARAELVALARTGMTAGHAVTSVQDFIERGVIDKVASAVGVPDARMRSALITSYLMGIAITRYGVRLEPLASASEEEVIRMVAPVIQDLLDPRKPIPGSTRARERAAGERARSAGQATTAPPARVRTFDPDPAATRAAREAEEAAVAALLASVLPDLEEVDPDAGLEDGPELAQDAESDEVELEEDPELDEDTELEEDQELEEDTDREPDDEPPADDDRHTGRDTRKGTTRGPLGLGRDGRRAPQDRPTGQRTRGRSRRSWPGPPAPAARPR